MPLARRHVSPCAPQASWTIGPRGSNTSSAIGASPFRGPPPWACSFGAGEGSCWPSPSACLVDARPAPPGRRSAAGRIPGLGRHRLLRGDGLPRRPSRAPGPEGVGIFVLRGVRPAHPGLLGPLRRPVAADREELPEAGRPRVRQALTRTTPASAATSTRGTTRRPTGPGPPSSLSPTASAARVATARPASGSPPTWSTAGRG